MDSHNIFQRKKKKKKNCEKSGTVFSNPLHVRLNQRQLGSELLLLSKLSHYPRACWPQANATVSHIGNKYEKGK